MNQNCAAVTFGIESANIVGYMNSEDTVGKKYAPVGAMFMTVGGDATWRLGDIKPAEGTVNYQSEYLQEFDPSTGAIGTKYCYVDATSAAKPPFMMWPAADKANAVGWWVKPATGFSPMGPGAEKKADNVTFKAGQGLYSNFGGAKAKLNFSGQVVCEEYQVDLVGKKYAPIINFLARPITLGEIVPEEGTLNYQSEYIQEFDPSTGAIGTKYCYVDAASAAKPPFMMWPAADKANAVGWWIKPAGGFTPMGPGAEKKADDVVIQPGAGFYSNFGGAKAKLNFPSAL